MSYRFTPGQTAIRWSSRLSSSTDRVPVRAGKAAPKIDALDACTDRGRTCAWGVAPYCADIASRGACDVDGTNVLMGRRSVIAQISPRCLGVVRRGQDSHRSYAPSVWISCRNATPKELADMLGLVDRAGEQLVANLRDAQCFRRCRWTSEVNYRR